MYMHVVLQYRVHVQHVTTSVASDKPAVGPVVQWKDISTCISIR